MRRLPTVAGWALLMALPTVARAADYHVASDGSDGAEGTAGAPWATLQFAAEQVAPGDTVHVAAGTYAGFQITTSGTEDARIAFVASDGVLIDEGGPTGDGIRLQDVSYVTIEGFTIVDAPERGIAHRGALATDPVFGLVIRRNTITNSNREGMYLSQVANSLVEGNAITDAAFPVEKPCIYLANAGSDGTALVGNVISGCGSSGMHFNGDLSIGGDGIISDVLVRGNVVTGAQGNGLNMDGVQDARIDNNVVHGNGGNGLRAYVIDGAEGPRGLVIVNNTMVDNQGWGVRLSDEGGGMVIFNNLLSGGNGGALAFKAMPVGLDASSNGIDGSYSVDGDTLLSLGEWSQMGFGEGSFEFQPGATFVAGGYALASTASAVDAGLDGLAGVEAPGNDVLGVARPVGAGVDVGAYEYCEGDCPQGEPGTGGGASGGSGGAGGASGVGGGGSGAGAGLPGGENGSSGGEEGGCSVARGPARSAPPGWTALGLLGLVVARRRRSSRCSAKERCGILKRRVFRGRAAASRR